MLIRLTLVTTVAIVGGMLVLGTEDDNAPIPDSAETAPAPAAETAAPVQAQPLDAAQVAADGKQDGSVAASVLPASMPENVETAGASAVADIVDAPATEPGANRRIVFVTGTRVNLRDGPSTDNAVVDQLARGTEAEVLGEAGDGWLQIRAVATGAEGYMSGNFLSPERPG